jgi:hypothetical protein
MYKKTASPHHNQAEAEASIRQANDERRGDNSHRPSICLTQVLQHYPCTRRTCPPPAAGRRGPTALSSGREGRNPGTRQRNPTLHVHATVRSPPNRCAVPGGVHGRSSGKFILLGRAVCHTSVHAETAAWPAQAPRRSAAAQAGTAHGPRRRHAVGLGPARWAGVA